MESNLEQNGLETRHFIAYRLETKFKFVKITLTKTHKKKDFFFVDVLLISGRTRVCVGYHSSYERRSCQREYAERRGFRKRRALVKGEFSYFAAYF